MSRGRQRLAILVAGALLAAVLGALVGASGDGGPPARKRVRAAAAPPPERPAPPGAVVLLSFDGTRLPAYVARILRRGDAAGAFLRPVNITGPAQLRALTTALRRAGGPGTLVAVDQEGGAVRAVPFAGPPTPPTRATSPSVVEGEDRAAGRELRALGITVDLAPVVDASRPGGALAGRTFRSPVAAYAEAAVRGLRASGVAPTAKHFPGLGAAAANTDDVPVTIGVPANELRSTDLPPFAAAIRAGVPLVMASHATYPALDPAHPASRSRAILTGLLRDRLGFRGVVVTDSMEAAAALRETTLESAALGSVRAGADLVLTTGPGSWIRVRRALAAEAARDPGFRARLAQAAARVAELRRSLARLG